ncbi:hypothetical protein SDC9_178559 [bioreactor metagenome]|uniref:Uncharacterized protein n=1 Tax=bioreactor metagenome TaxID=1076179 RepID=A0A645GWA8_9ZZZZ
MFVFMQVIHSDFCFADDGFTQQLLPFRPIQQTGAGREKLLIFPENHIAVGCIGDAAVLYDKRFIALPSPVIQRIQPGPVGKLERIIYVIRLYKPKRPDYFRGICRKSDVADSLFVLDPALHFLIAKRLGQHHFEARQLRSGKSEILRSPPHPFNVSL